MLNDPGRPTLAEVGHHSATHLRFRSWCPACPEQLLTAITEEGRSRGRWRLEVVSDCCFLGLGVEEKSSRASSGVGHRDPLILTHVAPWKGLADEDVGGRHQEARVLHAHPEGR